MMRPPDLQVICKQAIQPTPGHHGAGLAAVTAAAAVIAVSVVLLAGAFPGASLQAADYFGRGAAPQPGGSGDRMGGGFFGGIVMWLSGLQTSLNTILNGYLRSVRADGLSAAGPVIGAGFLYGVVHAAGPGHGKVVVASYFISTPSRVATGIAFSFLMAAVQALVAIALVIVFAVVIGTSMGQVAGQVAVVEPVGYALVAIIGAVMLWRSARGKPNCAHCASHGAMMHVPSLHQHGSSGPSSPADSGSGHGPVSPDRGWRRIRTNALAVLPPDLRVLAVGVGLRPCTGAILMLLFTLASGIFFVGVLAVLAMGIGVGLTVSAAALLSVAARTGIVRAAGAGTIKATTGARIARFMEIAGASFILVIGAALFIGTVATGGFFR